MQDYLLGPLQQVQTWDHIHQPIAKNAKNYIISVYIISVQQAQAHPVEQLQEGISCN